MEVLMNLSDSEWKVMKVLWENSPRTMTQITHALKEETNWTKHTIMSFLKRMEEKNAIHHEEGENAKLYYPDIDENEAELEEAKAFLQKVFKGKLGLMMHAMVEHEALEDEEIQELNAILEAAKREHESK